MSKKKKAPKQKRVYLFSNGTEYMMWLAGSCDRCVKASDSEVPMDTVTCDLEEAIFETVIAEDNKCPVELAKRLGWKEGEMMDYCTEVTTELPPPPFVPDITTLTLPLMEAANG